MTFRTKLILALLAGAFIHGIYNIFIPLHPDEAYYWLWSTHLDWSYYDHPGMIAWLIRLFSFLGDSEAAIRFTTVFCMTVSGYCMSMLAYRIKGESAGWITLIAFSVLPAVAMGYAFVTPDSPLIMFWCLAMYTAWLGIEEGKGRWFILTGVWIALMITSKYTAVLFVVSLGLYILFFNRKLLKNPYTWLGCVIGACGVIPIVIWNIQHDWISIKFQYAHGTSDTFKILWGEFFTLLGGIQLLPTPIFAFIIYKAAFYHYKKFRKEAWFRYLFTLFAFPLVFFLYKGLFAKIELNWPIIGFLSALPLMGIYVAQGYHRRLFKAGAILAGILTVILMASPFLPLPDSINISLRLKGNREAVEEFKTLIDIDENTQFFSNHLTVASIMSYYLEGHPPVHIPVGSRFSQITLWDEGIDFSKMSGYYLGRDDRPGQLIEKFGRAELVDILYTGSPTSPVEFFIYKVGGPH